MTPYVPAEKELQSSRLPVHRTVVDVYGTVLVSDDE